MTQSSHYNVYLTSNHWCGKYGNKRFSVCTYFPPRGRLDVRTLVGGGEGGREVSKKSRQQQQQQGVGKEVVLTYLGITYLGSN